MRFEDKPALTPENRCECVDRCCPEHPDDECYEPAEFRLERVDYEDSSLQFCDECGEDALGSGLFRYAS